MPPPWWWPTRGRNGALIAPCCPRRPLHQGTQRTTLKNTIPSNTRTLWQVPHKGPGTAIYHLSPFPRLRPCVAWQGSKEMGDHPATQLRRLCPGDVRASGGSILLVPMIAPSTVDLEECVRGVTETAELLLSSVAPLRQRGLELYVITKTHGYIGPYRPLGVSYGLSSLTELPPPDTLDVKKKRRKSARRVSFYIFCC